MATGIDAHVPARFGADRVWGERAAKPLRILAGAGARPTDDEIAALKAGLNRRDELGAALVRDVPGMSNRLRELSAAVQDKPAWVDDELVRKGAEACRTYGMDSGLVLAYGSLLGGYRTAAALEPLVRTGRLTGGETLRRIRETSLWWRAITAPGGLEPGGDGFTTTLRVRIMHALVNAELEKDPTWDWEQRGVPLNQYDLASTLGVFSTSFLLHLRLLGVRVTAADSRAVMHLWSYVGWLMGVDDAWLPHTERNGRRLLYHFLAYDPPPDRNSVGLARALIEMSGSRIERERALSVSTWLLGRRAMRDLGLPARPPWYGLSRVAANLVISHGLGRLPGGRERLLARGDRQIATGLDNYGRSEGNYGRSDSGTANTAR